MCVWGGGRRWECRECMEVDAKLQKRQSTESGNPERSMGEDKSLLQQYDLHGGKCGVPSVFKYLLMKTGRILEEMAMGNYFLLWEPGARGISIL